ncbi:MAG: AMP-binding protein, partial [Arthrobacter sp.]
MELLPVHTPAGYNAGDLLPPLAAALAGEGPAVAPHADPAQTFTGELTNDDVALVISTSGSTGTPKQTMLTTDALAASSMSTAMHLGLDGQWLLALPVHY